MRRALICLLLSFLAATSAVSQDVVGKAMRDELARSMEKLRIENLDKPYFISYRIIERTGQDIAGSFGGITRRNSFHTRLLVVELRVGDYRLDNTNYVSLRFGPSGVSRMFGNTERLPLDNDYIELRREIWLATDAAYKRAVEDLASKRAYLQNRHRTQEIPDFTMEEPFTASDVLIAPATEVNAVEPMVRDLSALFREMPDVFYSTVHFSSSVVDIRYVNSEGSSYHRTRPWTSMTIQAHTQAADGMPLDDAIHAYGHSLRDLPNQQEMTARVRELGSRMQALRKATTVELYDGPVLFEGQAAVELFAQVFVPKLLAVHPQLSENAQFERMAQQLDSFSDKLGARVLPSFMTVKDDPTLEQCQGKPLFGGYKADDDAVKARETVLVENGVLKTLLASRDPARGIKQSSGNRRGAGAMPSNVIVSSSQAVKPEELRQQFLKAVKDRGKEYGIVVRRIGNPSQDSIGGLTFSLGGVGESGRADTRVGNLTLAYRLYSDGHEELVRNLQISDLNISAFRDILAVSDTAEVQTMPFNSRAVAPQFGPTEGGSAIVSLAIPSLLFDEVTVKTRSGEFLKPPIATHPYFEPTGK